MCLRVMSKPSLRVISMSNRKASSVGTEGGHHHRRQEAEGIDDINTWGVLAAEGFLPGNLIYAKEA
jgi:hypothetical protein